MEHGCATMKAISINLRSLATVASLNWKGETSNNEERLFALKLGGTGVLMKIEAYRCPDCKVVLFHTRKDKNSKKRRKPNIMTIVTLKNTCDSTACALSVGTRYNCFTRAPRVQ